MTDYFLRATDEAAFVEACKALAAWDDAGEAPILQKWTADGETIWCLDPIGTIYEPTGETVTVEGEFAPVQQPVLAPLPGYHFNVRWLGPTPIPDPLPPGIEIIDPPPASPVRVFA